ncbi:unnamed protein product [Lampetra fluviatilis]
MNAPRSASGLAVSAAPGRDDAGRRACSVSLLEGDAREPPDRVARDRHHQRWRAARSERSAFTAVPGEPPNQGPPSGRLDDGLTVGCRLLIGWF